MKLKCLQCGHEYEGSVNFDNLGWHSTCPVCEGSFDVDPTFEEYVIYFVREALGRHCEKGDGYFRDEIYADYRDEMTEDAARKILGSEHPMEAFWEYMDDGYFEYSCELKDELTKSVKSSLEDDDGPYPEGLDDEQEEELDGIIEDRVCYDYPEEHYLKQTFYVTIMVDTGDGNYDYVLNSVYPSWYGRKGDKIDDKAGIVWLAKQQGYTKSQLKQALNEGDMSNPKGFLQSLRVEVANIASHMATVTFLVEMTLEDLIELNRLIKLQDRNGKFYDATKKPECGYIVIDKKAETGLFNPWDGGGSVFEIELEKDVKLPIKFIRSALPDGGDGYSVQETYGMCGSAWKNGKVKIIHTPKKLAG